MMLYGYLNLNPLWSKNATLIIPIACGSRATNNLIAGITKFDGLGIYLLLASYVKRDMNESDMRFRRVCLDRVRARHHLTFSRLLARLGRVEASFTLLSLLHQFQPRSPVRERKDIRPKSCTRIVVLLIAYSLEVIEEELPHRFKVATK